MAGRGHLDIDSRQMGASDQTSSVWALEGLGEDSIWKPAVDPIHKWVDIEELRIKCSSTSRTQPGVGPGIAFGEKIVEGLDGLPNSSPCQVGLIPTAVGGTSIEFWCPGCSLFTNMISQVEIGLKLAESVGTTPRLSGLLFYQGESDALTESAASAYESQLYKFIAGVRNHFGEDLPVILCAIGGADHRVPFKHIVRGVQLSAPSHLKNTACVDSSDLEFQADGLHLTSASQTILGARLADSWFRIKVPGGES